MSAESLCLTDIMTVLTACCFILSLGFFRLTICRFAQNKKLWDF